MKIVCDQNMPFAAEAFGTLGAVTLLPGRAIGPADVRDADILITRSTTKVTRSLLEGSRVRFYGSGVIGTDHIDIPWLEQSGIPWSAAPGCNAESVANYISAALLWLSRRRGWRLAGKTIGVVGVGRVGRKVCAHARALGLRVLACDPPRQRDPSDAEARAFAPLERLLAEADIITCHVPLNRDGPDRTAGLFDAAAFARLKPGAVFINAARGPVVVSDALLAALGRNVAQAALDTWEGEPAYRAELLARVDIGTPHIAGHSYEGKVNGTLMVYAAACRALGVTPLFQPVLPPPPTPRIVLEAAGRDDEAALAEAVAQVYDIAADDRRMRASCAPDADAAARAKAFDHLRETYPLRREFHATTVVLRGASASLAAACAGLGFRVERG